MSYLVQMNENEEGSTAPFIDNLEIIKVFKDEDEEEEASIMDFINQVSQLLRVELKELVDIAQAIIEPIKLYNEEW